jgi:hypothetical protein
MFTFLVLPAHMLSTRPVGRSAAAWMASRSMTSAIAHGHVLTIALCWTKQFSANSALCHYIEAILDLIAIEIMQAFVVHSQSELVS